MATVFSSPNTTFPPVADAWQVVSTFAPYLHVAHQISGRVRLKVDASALNETAVRDIGPERLRIALESIRGVHNIKLNLLARSCVVEYDMRTIPDEAWRDLLAGQKTPAAAILVAILQEKYEEIRHGKL